MKVGVIVDVMVGTIVNVAVGCRVALSVPVGMGVNVDVVQAERITVKRSIEDKRRIWNELHIVMRSLVVLSLDEGFGLLTTNIITKLFGWSFEKI